MKDQVPSRPVENVLLKIPSILFRGILGGIAGGVAVAMIFGNIVALFQVFHYAQFYSSWRLIDLIRDLISRVVGTALESGIQFGLPIGFLIGLSTGILAAIFGYHCPKLRVWLALSGIGVAIAWWFAPIDFSDWIILVGFTLIGLAASWMAYKSTIEGIKRRVPNEALQAYTFLASLSNLLMIFIMIYGFIHLLDSGD